jgi:hemolysin III
MEPVKPRLRGVSHQYAFYVAVVAGAVLVLLAPPGRATLAAAIYAIGLAGLLGTSALYHRVTWRPRARRWMRRLDHTMIFVLIAATTTPFALLVLDQPMSTVVLVSVWGGAALGAVVQLIWIEAPKWLNAAAYIALGWVGAVAVPQIWTRAGVTAVVLLAAGGLAYTVGAIVYARRRPDPAPTVFGYHEIFHALVIAAAIAHFAAVALYALPAATS